MRLPEALFVARTMRALELLALHPLSAPQVAEALEIHPRTARRLLGRLTDDGWLSRSEDARRVYAPTLRIASLAGHVLERERVVQAARPYVQSLSRELGDAHLVVPSYRWVLCVVHASGDGPAGVGLGELAPCNATAAGKALLAFRGEWLASVLGAPLERCTDRTITEPDALRAEAEAVRRLGYAKEDGERRPHARAVAAPVFARAGDAVAALGASVAGDRDLEPAAAIVAGRARVLSEEMERGDG